MFMTGTSNRFQKPLQTFIHSSKSVVIAQLQTCTTKKPVYSGTFFAGYMLPITFETSELEAMRLPSLVAQAWDPVLKTKDGGWH